MTLKRIHTDSNWWFCVFQAETGDDHVLIATVPCIGCYDIAMRLSADEVALFKDRPDDFISLARDFVASRDMLVFKNRKISFHQKGPDVIETELP